MTRPTMRAVYEQTKRPSAEMRYSIDVYNEHGNLIEHLADLDDLFLAHAAFVALCAKYPAKLIYLRQGAHVLGRSDELAAWMAAFRPIPMFEENPAAVPDDPRRPRPLPPDKRPQDLSVDGRGLTFKTLEHGGEYPDTMPQVIRLTDPLGRSALYVPLRVDGKVVDTNDPPA
jgi:hypothetical protein